MKQRIKLSKKDLHNIIMESVKRVLKEEEEDYNPDNETHFAVNKSTNFIVFGWDYSQEDPEDLRLFKKDYFINDLVNMDFNPKEYKILTRRTLEKRGLDPKDKSNWSNDGINPLSYPLK